MQEIHPILEKRRLPREIKEALSEHILPLFLEEDRKEIVSSKRLRAAVKKGLTPKHLEQIGKAISTIEFSLHSVPSFDSALWPLLDLNESEWEHVHGILKKLRDPLRHEFLNLYLHKAFTDSRETLPDKLASLKKQLASGKCLSRDAQHRALQEFHPLPPIKGFSEEFIELADRAMKAVAREKRI